MGISGTLGQAASFKAAGAEFLTAGVGDFLVPDKPDDVFEKNLEKLATSPLPILACNGFIRPAHLRCVGPDANHDGCRDHDKNDHEVGQLAGMHLAVGPGC